MVNLFTVLLQCKGVEEGEITQCFCCGFTQAEYREKSLPSRDSKAEFMKAKKAAFKPPLGYF